AIVIGVLTMTGCGPAKKDTSPVTLSIRIPTAQQLLSQSKLQTLSASAIDLSRGCFAVNITASDISSIKAGTCDVPVGIFAGFVAPGGQVTLTVPRGSSRKLEVFYFSRASSLDS